MSNEYIFITTEGYTEDPKDKPVENCQVIGYTKGYTTDQASRKLLSEYPYLKQTSFEHIIGYRIVKSSRKEFYISNLKKGELKNVSRT